MYTFTFLTFVFVFVYFISLLNKLELIYIVCIFRSICYTDEKQLTLTQKNIYREQKK